MPLPGLISGSIVYPETDGLPMAENTIEFEWILKLFTGIESQFRADDNVFVAGDLFWYPVEKDTSIRGAPDIMVAFGRPKGHRSSYLQWEEGGIAPQVVMEIRSPGNSDALHMEEIFEFYQTFGVEEYYVYDPASALLTGWQRKRGRLLSIPQLDGWKSPRLNIRFDTSGPELEVYDANGQRFLTVIEKSEQDALKDQKLTEAEEKARKEARRANAEFKRAEDERKRAEELIGRLRAKGIDPDAI
jgi:Uma2 family endonuclease